MSKKKDNRMALIIVGSIIGGIVLGGIAGGRIGFNLGIPVEEMDKREASLETKKAFASQLKLVFNERVENASSELVKLCSRAQDECNQDILDAMLISLDEVLVDESIINSLLD